MSNKAQINVTAQDDMMGKYLLFTVEDNEYAVEIVHVTEIIDLQQITPVPNTFDYIKGIINLRGTIVPVIEMRIRFNCVPGEYDERTCIIVLSMEDMNVGLVVDSVQEVRDMADEDILPPSPGSMGSNSRFIKAVGHQEDGVKQIIDIVAIFGTQG